METEIEPNNILKDSCHGHFNLVWEKYLFFEDLLTLRLVSKDFKKRGLMLKKVNIKKQLWICERNGYRECNALDFIGKLYKINIFLIYNVERVCFNDNYFFRKSDSDLIINEGDFHILRRRYKNRNFLPVNGLKK